MIGETTGEKPLTRSAKLAVNIAAGLAVLASYLLMLVVMACLLALVGIEVLLCFGHVGLAAFFGKLAPAHLKLLSAFVKSLWLKEEADYQVALQPADAPALWAMLENLCDRLGLAIPDEIRVGMGANASVRLFGSRRGAGRITLAIGYDLFAGFSKPEFEAVMAHELAHAKLVQRGVQQWIGQGLGRTTALAESLWSQVIYRDRGQAANPLCYWLAKGARQMAIWIARRFAACSRQDEFEADQGAAELCGAAIFGRALAKTAKLGQAAERLPWRDRMARIDAEEDFGRWLTDELASGQAVPIAAPDGTARDPYSTHPSLADRLAALPVIGEPAPEDTTSALALLAAPNVVAGRLATEILRLSALAEERDERELQRWTRKAGSGADLRPLQVGGVVLFALAVIFLLASFAENWSREWLVTATGCITAGVICYAGGRRLRPFGSVLPDFATALPIPPYGVFKGFWDTRPSWNQEAAKKIESELKARWLVEKKRRKLTQLVRECYQALARGDYLVARVASDVALQCGPKCPEALLGQAIACAAFGEEQGQTHALAALHKATGMREASVCWGFAWSLVLSGDWVGAEAWLGRARQAWPAEPVLWMLRAVCQASRGKLQGAVTNARLACDARPEDPDQAAYLIHLLLESGFLREAAARLERFAAVWKSHAALRMTLIRLKLLQRDPGGAEEWIRWHTDLPQPAAALVSLGALFHSVRGHERAATFYREALKTGFCPEAHFGLGRLEIESGQIQSAREHFLAALDVNREVPPECGGSLNLLPAVLEQLLGLGGPVARCRAWTAKLSPAFEPALLGNLCFLVCAPEIAGARQFLETLLAAMTPGTALRWELITWEEADSQPPEPIGPGVYQARYL